MKDQLTRRFAARLIAAVAMLSCIAASSATDNGQVMSLTIDAKVQGAVISPLLFAHNLEVTRRAIWRGLGAEMVANRKFAAVASVPPVMLPLASSAWPEPNVRPAATAVETSQVAPPPMLRMGDWAIEPPALLPLS